MLIHPTYLDVINGSIHVNLPMDFSVKRVELIILSVEDKETDNEAFQQFLLDSPDVLWHSNHDVFL